jgi:3-(3-hydroxy-phenyl)propionate hydroxylase
MSEAMHDVAIVGLGPTGATLANLLAQRGLDVLVIEREAEIHRLPRAIHFDGECMRVFQAIGIAEQLLPRLVISPGMKFVDAAGRVLIDYTRSQQPGPHGWHPSYRYHHPDLEAALRARLATHESATVLLRHDIFAVDEHADHVELRLEDLARGRLLRAKARFVVGCDGARSLLRRLIDSELDDLQAHERWLVLDVLLKRARPDLGEHSIQYCDPRRPATYVRGVGERRRFELMLMPGDDAASIARPQSVWPLLERWLGPDDAELERPAVYTFHSVVARGWRRDRLLIAGDAAHQTPPFMGQGMCAGIRDAANLAWKLAEVVRGHAGDALLDSYESERAPHARAFIETAVRLGAVIQATDPEIVRQRDATLAANPQVFTTPQPALGPGAHDGGEVGGHTAAQPRLADGRLADEHVGPRFALIARADLAALAADDDRLAVLPAAEPALQAWLAALDTDAVLLRPDRYVAGAAADANALRALLARHRLALHA